MILQHGASERLPEAREEFEQEVQLDPQSVYSNFFLGVLASTAGEHAKAIRYLEETTRLNPTLARPICFWDSLKPKWVMPELKRVCAAQSSWLSTSLITASKSRRLTSLLGACWAGRRAEGEKELALAKEMQAKSLEGSREEISEILDQAAKSTKGISAPSQIAAQFPTVRKVLWKVATIALEKYF